MATPRNRILELFESGALARDSDADLDLSDGRVANRIRNRQKVLDSFVELVNEGSPAGLDEIVERSGVARRSVFRYFTDLSDLAMEGFRQVIERASTDADLADPGQRSLSDRVDEVVRVRLRTMQQTHRFGLHARSKLGHIEAVEEGLNVVADVLRGQFSEHFAQELQAVPSPERERILDRVLVAVSAESYDVLVRRLGRSAEEVEEIWRGLLHAILVTS